jgi:hypothetical protein
MANTNAPFGFKPARNAYGAPYNGSLSTYKLNSGYGTAIYPGDAVKLLTTGYLAKAAAGDTIAGIAVGFSWVQASGQPNTQRYWPASTTTLNSADAQVQVIDDPNVIFEVQFGNSTSVPATADIGALFDLYDAGGSATNASSGEGIDYTTLATSGKGFRFVGFVPRVDNDLTSAYSRGLFAPVLHAARVQTGI